MSKSIHFQFGTYKSCVSIREKAPRSEFELFDSIGHDFSALTKPVLAVCDENTALLASDIFGLNTTSDRVPSIRVLQLPSGEENKNWPAVETILRTAKEAGLGRDGLFIGIGGGVICDCTAFAASIYMRGTPLALIPTTLLCMADAALGGKTGLNINGIKNLAGTFYPAGNIIIATELLVTLPQREWKSGIAEIIKTAIIEQDHVFFNELQLLTAPLKPKKILPFIEKAVQTKGRIVENDPYEKTVDYSNGHTNGTSRALLNLGHSFGHALESALLPGTQRMLSHGEAVAWGIAKSCELGQELQITPPDRAKSIVQLLHTWDFETSNDFFKKDRNAGKTFRNALLSDKKKKDGKLRFVVPAEKGVVLVEEDNRVAKFLRNSFK